MYFPAKSLSSYAFGDAHGLAERAALVTAKLPELERSWDEGDKADQNNRILVRLVLEGL